MNKPAIPADLYPAWKAWLDALGSTSEREYARASAAYGEALTRSRYLTRLSKRREI